MGAMSRRKGKRGELEVVGILRPIFPEAKRGFQSRDGGAEAADVENTGPLHVECKRQKRPNIVAALEQATEDAEGSGKFPAAFTRRDRGEWLVTMRADDFVELLSTWR